MDCRVEVLYRGDYREQRVGGRRRESVLPPRIETIFLSSVAPGSLFLWPFFFSTLGLFRCLPTNSSTISCMHSLSRSRFIIHLLPSNKEENKQTAYNFVPSGSFGLRVTYLIGWFCLNIFDELVYPSCFSFYLPRRTMCFDGQRKRQTTTLKRSQSSVGADVTTSNSSSVYRDWITLGR